MKRNLKHESGHHLSENLNSTAEATKSEQNEAVYNKYRNLREFENAKLHNEIKKLNKLLEK